VKYLSLIILVLTLSACRDYAEVKIDNQSASIDWKDGGATAVSVTPWRVGPYRKQMLSMGARVKVEFPALKEDDIELLGKNFDVDSWLVSIQRSGLGRRQRLASYYMPLFKRSGRSGTMGVSSAAMGYLDLYYAAAAISTRLRNLECPGLEHRRLLEKAEIREVATGRPMIVVSSMQEYSFQNRVERLDFQRNIINLGESVEGEYQISFALYNSKKNRVLSNDAISPQVIVLSNEKTERIRGCENLKTPPAKQDGANEIQNFKFGR
tara:strand:- start:15238 stop:16035 length:798 start_codon:yes stop_codon:yes gene_type:complete